VGAGAGDGGDRQEQPSAATGKKGGGKNSVKIATCASLVGLLCGLLSLSATASTSYVCVTDMATGFAFDQNRKQWRTADFNAGKKYLVSKATGEPYAWEVKEIGTSWALMVCAHDFNEGGSLFCKGTGMDLSMNKKTLRFLVTYPVGYWADNVVDAEWAKEGANSPYMAIGKCSPL
jgi:hypothetical protein